VTHCIRLINDHAEESARAAAHVQQGTTGVSRRS
jgi:hypothetical protein